MRFQIIFSTCIVFYTITVLALNATDANEAMENLNTFIRRKCLDPLRDSKTDLLTTIIDILLPVPVGSIDLVQSLIV